MSRAGNRIKLTGTDQLQTLTLHPGPETPPLLDVTTRSELDQLLEDLEDDPPKRLLLTSTDEDWFCAGADVDELADISSKEAARALSREGQMLLHRLDQLSTLTIAALHGDALGGGLELALACDAILLVDDPMVGVGLPEVKLGIIPGFGGTQRLPRKIGLQNALKMILTGRKYTPLQARNVHLVEKLLPPEGFKQRAKQILTDWTRETIESRQPSSGFFNELLEETGPGRHLVFKRARQKTRQRMGDHYPAPFTAIEAIEKGTEASIEEGLEIEADLVSELAQEPSSQHLMQLFQNMESLKELPEETRDEPLKKRAGVIGAGVMGGGIAQLFAYRGFQCRLKDVDASPLQDGMRRARSVFERGVGQGRWTESFVRKRMESITPTLNWNGFGRTDVLVEAVPEKLEIKQQVFQEMEQHTSSETLLATNTSSIKLENIAEEMNHPSRLLGLHFFNPVYKMQLVEVIKHQDTSEEHLHRARRLVKELGKVPVVVKDGPGFLVNRLLFFYLQEAMILFREGAGIKQIDEVMESFGMPQGPFEVMDQVGLDIAADVSDTLQSAFGDRSVDLKLLPQMLDRGWRGKKSDRGFYEYGGDDATVNRDLSDLIGREHRDHGADEIRDRLLLALINEAVRAHNEGIVASPEELDTAMILGTGFAPFRGGPWTYAADRGWSEIRDMLNDYQETFGIRFRPPDNFPGTSNDDNNNHNNDDNNNNNSGNSSNSFSDSASSSSQHNKFDVSSPEESRKKKEETTPEIAIVFSGGGARGAYEAGVLSGICEHVFPELEEPPKINILVGTSSGAVNAYYLAGCLDNLEEGINEMARLWKDLDLEEHLVPASTGTFSLLRWLLGGSKKQRMSILDPSSIRNMIKNDFPWERIRPNMSRGLLHSLCITATELHTGETILFTDTVLDELPEPPVGRFLNWVRTQILPVHVFGSSSIPLLYPATRIDGTLYYDGGLRMDVPITPALSLGAKKVLVIGVNSARKSVPQEVTEKEQEEAEEMNGERELQYPGAPEMIGKILNALLLDPVERERSRIFALQEIINDSEKNTGPDFSKRVADLLIPYIGGNLRDTSFYFHRPERDIGVLAKEFIPDVADRLGGLWGRVFHRFASSRATGNWDLASYMLFDGQYTSELIHQGEEDVEHNKSQLMSFFRE